MVNINIAEILVAVTGLMTPFGIGIRYVFNEFKSIRKELDQCEEGRAMDRVVIELFWQALSQSDPNSPILARAKIVLDELKDKHNKEISK